jgi:hypothetical protein
MRKVYGILLLISAGAWAYIFVKLISGETLDKVTVGATLLVTIFSFIKDGIDLIIEAK